MKFIKSHIRLFEILFCIFSIFLAVMIALYVAGDQNKNTINSAFGLDGSRTERVEPDDGEELEEVDTDYYPATYSSESDLISAYEALCREVEEEGLVLLSNDGALPLAKGSKVSLFGQGARDFCYETGGSSSTGAGDTYATLKDAFEYQNRLDVNDDLWNYMDSIYGVKIYDDPTDESKSHTYGGNILGATSGYTINEAPFSLYGESGALRDGDAAIVVISRASGEGTDLTAAQPSGTLSGRNSVESREYGEDGSYLSLSVDEVDILKNLTTMKSNGQISSIIVLLNTSATVQLDFLERDGIDVDACMWIGNVGSHGAYAVAEALVGDVNPSGKLVDTYLKNNFSSPAMASWGYNDEKSPSQSYTNASELGLSEVNSNFAVYVEGIYVGYRYFETRYEDAVMGTGNTKGYDYNADVAFPFGHGESYTTFEYSEFSATPSDDGDSFEVEVTVTNTGSVPGKETVEIYLQKPYSEYDKTNGVETASVELVGYYKTGNLAASESEVATIVVDKEQLRSYDTDGAGTYILDEGDYYLTAATDSHDAVNNILAAKGYTTSNGMDADGDANLASLILTTTKVDSEIFATSSETGVEIGNELDEMDINKYSNRGDNGTTYVSRSDWTATFPTTNEKITVGSGMYQDLQSNWISYDEEAKNYKKPSYGKNNGMTLMMLRERDYDDEDWDELLDQMTYAEQAEFVTLGYHVTGAVESIAKPATTDENGPTAVIGSVTGYCLPSEGIWAATFNDELIGRIGELLGDDCIMAGIQGFYAPGVNIHRTGFIGRSHEYFSEDPYLSGMASVAEIKGIQSRGVIAYVKHFAFNDIDTDRNGISIWLNEQSAREIYLLPFEYSMRPSVGNSHAVMTSFNRAGCRWSSACSELLIDIARGEWGFDGYYITDMSTSNGAAYMTYYDGISNGTNIYDGTPANGLSGRLYNNNYFRYMLRDSCHRILYNVVNYSAAMNGMDIYTRVYKVTNWWQILIIVLLVIAVVGAVAAIVFYVLAEVFSRKDKGDDGNGGGGVRPRDADDDCDASGGVTSSEDIE